MKSRWRGFQSCLAPWIQQYLAYKRAIARRFDVEERTLRLLDRYLVRRGIRNLPALTPEVLDVFLATRPRRTPHSYNHLRSTVARLFDWAVAQGLLDTSPLRTRPRSQTGGQRSPFLFTPAQARQLLDVAGRLPDRSCAPLRGLTYRTIFALLYGLGLRVGEVARLCRQDVDLEHKLLVIRQTKFAKSRLVPFGDRIAALLTHYLESCAQCRGPWQPHAPVFSFIRGRPLHSGTISQTFHHLVPRLQLPLLPGVSPLRLPHEIWTRDAFFSGAAALLLNHRPSPATSSDRKSVV